jgi:hypothetical protein
VKKKLEKKEKEQSPGVSMELEHRHGGNDFDKTYLEINQTSFQENFKALIGHYKVTLSFEG